MRSAYLQSRTDVRRVVVRVYTQDCGECSIAKENKRELLEDSLYK